MYKNITWNTALAAERWRFKNKKIKPQATSRKRQASSNKRLTK